jgi:colanic acid/amylovoran biosynthesis glycosyltransferase
MRLLFLNGPFPTLSQTFVLDHIAHAVKRGHETSVATSKLDRTVVHPVINELRLYNTIIYNQPKDRTYLARIMAGVISHPFRIAGAFQRCVLGRPMFREIALALQLRREPDVIVANFGPNGISAARLKACLFPKSKVVVVFHGYDMSSYIAKHGWQSYRDMAQLVDLAICVNTGWAELIRRETSMRNVVTLHLGVHCDQMPRRVKHRTGEFSILFAGRMTEKKGFDQLVQAVAILHAKKVPVRVHAIGDGVGLPASTALISTLGLEKEFVIYGAREHDFVLKLMSEVDCVVAPSITARNGDQEGIPVALMEAMAIGTPVISTRHSGIPELIVEGESGLLVDERDVRGLSDCIERLVLNPRLCEELGNCGQVRVRSHFNADTQNTALFRLIESLSETRAAEME